MEYLLTIIRERRKLGFDPDGKVVVDGKAQYTLKPGDTLNIPLSSDIHTIDFTTFFLKKSMVLQVTEDTTLTTCWNQLTGVLDVAASSSAERSMAPFAEAPTEEIPQPIISADTKEAIRGGVQSAQKSLKSLWGNIKAEALKARQDAAIKAAYKKEEERRKPRIEKIEHRRGLDVVEQQTIDAAELEIKKLYQDYLANKMPLHEYWSRKASYQSKINEIQNRAVWYETIEYPPEIDPSVPIEIDEEAIRASIK